MPQIRFKNGPARGRVVELSGEVVRLGREGEVQILDAAASRQHAEIFSVGDMFFIRDLGSRNGTFLNDERLAPEDEALLRVGDQIRIGSTRLVFEERGAQANAVPEFTSGEEDLGSTVELSLETETAGPREPETHEASVHYSVLYDVAKAVSSSYDVDSLMQRVCEITLKATPADAVYVFVHEAGRLVPAAHARRVERRRLKVSKTIVKRALQHNRAILVSDVLSDSRFSGSDSVVMKGVRSVVCAPLLAHKHLEGVLYLHSGALENAFTDDHLRLVTGIALQTAVAVEAMRAEEESRRQLMSVFRTLVRAHEQASPTAREGHSERVLACAQAICDEMGLPAAERRVVELAALLHEVGKIGAPEGAFEREEAQFEYATLGARMLREIEGLDEVAAAVEAHLERLDGSGGPKRLVGHQVGRPARIVGLADEFERRVEAAVSAGRKRPEAVKDALVSLNAEVGEMFDEEAFGALVRALRSGALVDF